MLTPDGTYEIIDNGKILIKIGINKYMPKARYLYEKAHDCKLSTDELVVCLDGNNFDLDIDNLIKITRAEQMLMAKIYGGFTGTAEENLLHLQTVRVIHARKQLAKKYGILVSGEIPADKKARNKRYMSDPQKKKRKCELDKAYKRKRYAEDEAYREKLKELSRQHRLKKKLQS